MNSSQLEDIDFGRRMAVERELWNSAEETHGPPNAIFDESGNFLFYATLLGVKVRVAQAWLRLWICI